MSNVSSTIGQVIIATPTLATVTLTTANQEYSYSIPAGSKRFKVQNRETGLVKIYYSTGASDYWTMWPGNCYEIEGLAKEITTTLYFKSPKASQILEIETWV